MQNLKLVVLLLVGACASDDTSGDDQPPGGDLGPFTEGISTLTGHWDPGYVDGPRGTARFANPVNTAVGPDGKVYVADFDNGKIRVADPETGATSTLIAQENFRRPFAMAFASDGTLYVTTDKNTTSDQQSPMSGTVWRVNVAQRSASVVAENIGRPRGIAVLPDGRLAIGDYQHHVIQIVDPTTRQVTLLSGTWDAGGMVEGVGAKFNVPYGMAVAGGQIVVADQMNNRIRRISLDGTVQTLAGTGAAGNADGALAAATFNGPQGVAVDSAGRIYISDTNNYRIRRISGDVVETIAGSGEPGYIDNDDPLQGQVFGIEGLGVNAAGTRVYVADGGRGEDVPHNFVRVINLD